jgi:hypothetical protein
MIAIALLGFVLGALLVAGRSAPELRIVVPALKGDGALILTPDGHAILIDGGADGASFAAWLGETLPLGRRRIDAIILTRADSATLPGQIAAIRRYRIDQAVVASSASGDNLDSWHALLADQGTRVLAASAGERLTVGSCDIDLLAARADRLAIRIACGPTTAYFLQSLDLMLESALLDQPLDPATIVLYPWSRPTQTQLMEQLAPAAIVFAEGEGGRAELTWHDRQLGAARLLHESLHGQIDFIGAGQDTRVRTARGDVHENR